VAHVHAGVGYTNRLMVGAHYMRAFSQDEHAGSAAPDGRIDVYAGDVRLNLGRFGHFYEALSYTDALQARTVSRVFSVLTPWAARGSWTITSAP